jgi:hypothetical protein
MSLGKGFVFFCAPEIEEKIRAAVMEILLKDLLPFDFFLPKQDKENSDDEKALFAQNHHCLLFADTHEESVRRLEALIELQPERNHQACLVAGPKDDYRDIAIRFHWGIILVRDHLDAAVLAALTRRVLGDAFFGFAPFFPQGGIRFTQSYTVSGMVETRDLANRLFPDFIDRIPETRRPFFVSQCGELLLNALAYGVAGITESERDSGASLGERLLIPKGKEVTVRVVEDGEKYGFSVTDPGGSLTLRRILEKLRRQTVLPHSSIPEGITDLSGRGIFIVSRQSRLIFNIHRGVATEAIILYYFEESQNHYQPLILNERV